MLKFSINKNQFSDLLNLYYNVFYPLKSFVNEKKFNSILLSNKLNNNFFPIPIYFGINKNNYNKIRENKFLKLYYRNKYLCLIKINNFFKIKKEIFGKKIFGKNFNAHPFYQKYCLDNYTFLDFNIEKLNKKNLNHKSFLSPVDFKKKIKTNTHLAGFHTRNVPHTAHQWAHHFMLKKFKRILIQPLIGQYKKNEYFDSIIERTNKKVVNMYGKKNAFYAPFFSYPRYGGPLEALLHALVRKNYGCTHFWVGRDHAGFKDFYTKYQSQKFCKLNERKLGIKIVSEKEPYYCVGCKKIVNKNCLEKYCKSLSKKMISGTKIRKLIQKNKKIPKYLMHKNISNLLDKNSIRSK